MQLSLASSDAETPVEYFVDVDSLPAALVLIKTLMTWFDSGRLRVVATVTHLGNGVIFLTAVAAN